MRTADRLLVRELIRRELDDYRAETGRRFLELEAELRAELADEVAAITRRIDHVHKRALRALTLLTEKGAK